MGQEQLQIALQEAIHQAYKSRHEYVTVEHLLYALISQQEAQEVVHHAGGNVEELKTDLRAYLHKEVPTIDSEGEEITVERDHGGQLTRGTPVDSRPGLVLAHPLGDPAACPHDIDQREEVDAAAVVRTDPSEAPRCRAREAQELVAGGAGRGCGAVAQRPDP